MEWVIAIVFVLLLLVSVYDVRTRIIPNEAILFLVAIRILSELIYVETLYSSALISSFACVIALVVCLCVLSLIMEKVLGKPAFGMGDVKLIGALSLFLEPSRIFTFLWASCFAMMATAIVFAVKRERAFPCAPAISIGFAVAVLIDFGCAGLW